MRYPFVGFIVLLCQITMAADVDPFEKAKLETARQLLHDGYFRAANCAEVANIYLDSVGLPKIGASKPVAGRRGILDRSRQSEDPPIFSDSSETDQHLKMTIAASFEKSSWTLTIHRANAAATLTTRLTFGIVRANNVENCDLHEASFSAPEAQKVGLTDPLKSDTCLELFVRNYEQEAKASPKFAETLTWMKKDCALAGHYSSHARQLATQH